MARRHPSRPRLSRNTLIEVITPLPPAAQPKLRGQRRAHRSLATVQLCHHPPWRLRYHPLLGKPLPIATRRQARRRLYPLRQALEAARQRRRRLPGGNSLRSRQPRAPSLLLSASGTERPHPLRRLVGDATRSPPARPHLDSVSGSSSSSSSRPCTCAAARLAVPGNPTSTRGPRLWAGPPTARRLPSPRPTRPSPGQTSGPAQQN
jgi:hypothetical protein